MKSIKGRERVARETFIVRGRTQTVADLEFLKGGVQYAIKARVARLLGGSGGMSPQENFMIFDLLRSFLVYSWGEIAKSWTTYY